MQKAVYKKKIWTDLLWNTDYQLWKVENSFTLLCVLFGLHQEERTIAGSNASSSSFKSPPVLPPPPPASPTPPPPPPAGELMVLLFLLGCCSLLLLQAQQLLHRPDFACLAATEHRKMFKLNVQIQKWQYTNVQIQKWNCTNINTLVAAAVLACLSS